MNDSTYLLGLDLGTTRVKALLVSPARDIVADADGKYPLNQPTSNAAEQDPEDWWKASCEVIRAVINKSGADPEEIAAVGLAGQMHTAVFLDDELEPVRPAITWADNRATSEAREIERKIGKGVLLNITYNRSLPGFTAPKVLWVKNHEPKLFTKIDKLVLPKDYLRYQLTGNLSAEKAGASATLLFDLEEEDWSDQLLKLVGLTRENVPPLTESSNIVGRVSRSAAEQTGLLKGTPVIAGAGDQQAGALGIGAIKPGIVVSTIGTGGQLFTTTQNLVEPEEGRIHVFRQCLPDSWHVMGAMQTAGLALRWYKENIINYDTKGELNFEEISQLAREVPAGSDKLLFLPYLSGERSPHLDPNARGCFIGLSLDHELPHLLRSIMEGVTFGMKDSLKIFQSLGLSVQEIRCSGGGAKSSTWRQIQADIYKQPVVTTNVEENAAFGAALLAGIGTELYSLAPEEICERSIDITNTIRPEDKNLAVYDELYERFQALYRELKPEFQSLSKIKT